MHACTRTRSAACREQGTEARTGEGRDGDWRVWGRQNTASLQNDTCPWRSDLSSLPGSVLSCRQRREESTRGSRQTPLLLLFLLLLLLPHHHHHHLLLLLTHAHARSRLLPSPSSSSHTAWTSATPPHPQPHPQRTTNKANNKAAPDVGETRTCMSSTILGAQSRQDNLL